MFRSLPQEIMGSFMPEEGRPVHGDVSLAAVCAPDMDDMTAYWGHTVGHPDLPWAAGPP